MGLIRFSPICILFYLTACFSISGPLTLEDEKERRPIEPETWAFISDLHISENVKHDNVRGANVSENFINIREQILAAQPKISGVFIAGDISFSKGRKGDYSRASALLEPFKKAALPLYITLGNHDAWRNFSDVMHQDNFMEEHPEKTLNSSVIRSGMVNWILLDSVVPNNVGGQLGKEQFVFLEEFLDKNPSKPAILIFHHPPLFLNKNGLTDSDELFKIITSHKQVKAIITGHSHKWQISEKNGVYIIVLPAVSYALTSGQLIGWMRITPDIKKAKVEFYPLAPDGSLPRSPQVTELLWRTDE